MLLRRSRISTCCCGDPEFCRSAEAVGRSHVDTAVKDFAIFIPSSSFVVLLRLWRSSPLCCGCQEFRHVAKSGISPCYVGNFHVVMAVRNFATICLLNWVSGISPCWYGGRKFRFVAKAVGNVAVFLRLSGISPCCYGGRESRRAVAAIRNFAVLLRLSGGAMLTRLSRILPYSFLPRVLLCCYGCGEVRRFAAAVRNFVMLLTRKFRCVASAVVNLAVLVRQWVI